MDSSKFEYVEFSLIDPTKLSRLSTYSATVMTIGALLNKEAEEELFTKPDMRASSMPLLVKKLDENLGEMAHRAGARRTLHRKAGGSSTLFMHYCSRCGGRLSRTQCRRCGIKFGKSVEVATSSIDITPKVATYAFSHGHKFTQRPLRPY